MFIILNEQFCTIILLRRKFIVSKINYELISSSVCEGTKNENTQVSTKRRWNEKTPKFNALCGLKELVIIIKSFVWCSQTQTL